MKKHRFFLHQIILEPKLNGRQKVKGGLCFFYGSGAPRVLPSFPTRRSSVLLGVGCAPSCWPIFGFRNLLGARRGLRGQFSVQSDNRFSGRGGGGGEPPQGVAGGLGWSAQRPSLKQLIDWLRFLLLPPLRIPTSQGRGGLGLMGFKPTRI